MTCTTEENLFDQTWIAGDYEKIVICYKDSDGNVISYDSAKMQLRRKTSSDTYALEIIGEFDEDTGYTTFNAYPEDTRAIATSSNVTYVYDIEITISSTNIKTIGSGKITMSPDVTR